jgi:hypothetical protein
MTSTNTWDLPFVDLRKLELRVSIHLSTLSPHTSLPILTYSPQMRDIIQIRQSGINQNT